MAKQREVEISRLEELLKAAERTSGGNSYCKSFGSTCHRGAQQLIGESADPAG